MSKKVIILGSSGSIGQNAVQVCQHLGYTVVGLAVGSDTETLKKQIELVSPEYVAVHDEEAALKLQKEVSCTVLVGEEGVCELAQLSADIVVAAIVGTKGIRPVFAALEQGTDVALANKEALVSAGALMMQKAKMKNARIIPIDSEHSALLQCQVGEQKNHIHSLTLTASGGPFLHSSQKQLEQATIDDALNHPTWRMGVKNTIDSSTLMNKGLEVIEAHHLFDLPLEQINVVVHPQSLIHSFVTFVDGSSKAQISPNDMRIPIQYALTFPDRAPGLIQPLNFSQLSTLEFYPPDMDRFPCLQLALHSINEGGSMPCFMNAVNEVLVGQFVQRKIGWIDIGRKLEKLMQGHNSTPLEDIEHVLSIDTDARTRAAEE